MCDHLDDVKKLNRALITARTKIASEERQSRDLRLSLDEAKVRICDLEVEVEGRSHKIAILESQKEAAEESLEDMQHQLSQMKAQRLSSSEKKASDAMEEARELEKETRGAREEASQLRVDISFVSGEMAGLEQVTDRLAQELAEARCGPTKQDLQNAREDRAKAKAEVERLIRVVDDLNKRMGTYERLLNNADRELVTAQEEAEGLRKRNAELLKKGNGDGRWQVRYRSQEVRVP